MQTNVLNPIQELGKIQMEKRIKLTVGGRKANRQKQIDKNREIERKKKHKRIQMYSIEVDGGYIYCSRVIVRCSANFHLQYSRKKWISGISRTRQGKGIDRDIDGDRQTDKHTSFPLTKMVSPEKRICNRQQMTDIWKEKVPIISRVSLIFLNVFQILETHSYFSL